MPPDVKNPEKPERGRVSEACRELLAEVRAQHYNRLVNSVEFKLPFDEKNRRPVAEDIVAEVFAKALQQCPREEKTEIIKYVYTAVNNARIDYCRRRNTVRRTKTALIYALESAPPPSPEALYLEQEAARVVHQAIQSLPPKCRMAYILYEWHDVSIEDIVAQFASLGITTSKRSIQRYVEHARNVCLQALKAYEQGKQEGIQ